MEDKVSAVKQWRAPTTVYHVRSFLGAVGYYRKFIPRFAELAEPLTALTRDVPTRPKTVTANVTKQKFGRRVRTLDITSEWTEACERSFQVLKDALLKAPILVLPDPRKPYELMCDASGKAMGAVLMQRHEDGLHPVAYYSKKLVAAEQHYPVHEQELLALFMSLKHWRHLLLGQHLYW